MDHVSFCKPVEPEIDPSELPNDKEGTWPLMAEDEKGLMLSGGEGNENEGLSNIGDGLEAVGVGAPQDGTISSGRERGFALSRGVGSDW